MHQLPAIPDWIRHVHKEPWFPHAHYTNALELLRPQERRLYGTETMYGDWDATVFLLLQDWSTSRDLRERISNPGHRFHADPWCHNPTLRTNLFLQRGFGPAGSAGKLYGSALAALLKNTEGLSDSLPPRSAAVRKFLQQVLAFALSNMLQLRSIVCFGTVAAELVEVVCAPRTPLIQIKGTRTSVKADLPDGREVHVFWAKHPSRGWSYEQMRAFGTLVMAT